MSEHLERVIRLNLPKGLPSCPVTTLCRPQQFTVGGILVEYVDEDHFREVFEFLRERVPILIDPELDPEVEGL